jgi:hypothetical protein
MERVPEKEGGCLDDWYRHVSEAVVVKIPTTNVKAE